MADAESPRGPMPPRQQRGTRKFVRSSQDPTHEEPIPTAAPEEYIQPAHTREGGVQTPPKATTPVGSLTHGTNRPPPAVSPAPILPSSGPESAGVVVTSPLMDSGEKKFASITVAVRKRPRQRNEMHQQDVMRTQTSNNTIAVFEPKTKVDMTRVVEPSVFPFDVVFDETATNRDVYESTTRPLLGTVLSGGNACVFAFGQTGSGKTHTMLGSEGQEEGVYLLACRDMFRQLNREHKMVASFYEIYNGKLFDLMNDRSKVTTLEDDKHNINLVGLTFHRIRSAEEMTSLMKLGSTMRSSGATGANARSSRSHAVLTLTVQKIRDNSLFGKMAFVDLAGSERAADTSNNDKKTRAEGADINKSLLALKECIRAMDQRSKHIPFRGSKLTQILRDCFYGNAATTMIANASPCQNHCEDTLNTLRYAYRVKEIKTSGDTAPAAGLRCVRCGYALVADGKTTHVCPKVFRCCPHCKVDIDVDQLEQHKRACLMAPVPCDACGMNVKQGEMQKHKKRCGKASVACQLCGETVARDALQRHVTTDCAMSIVSCVFCKTLMPRRDLDPHKESCDQIPVPCEHCNAVLQRRKMALHQKTCSKLVRRASSFFRRQTPDTTPTKSDARRSTAVGFAMDDLPPQSTGPQSARGVEESSHSTRDSHQSSPRARDDRRRKSKSLAPIGAGREMCPHCSKTFAASQMEHHLAHECPYMTVSCPFMESGCLESVTRAGLSRHLTSNLEHHLLLVHGKSVALKAENELLKTQLRERDSALMTRLDKLEVQIPRPPPSEAPKAAARKSSATPIQHVVQSSETAAVANAQNPGTTTASASSDNSGGGNVDAEGGGVAPSVAVNA